MLVQLGTSIPAQAAPTAACGFDPNLGKPNPLGMRAFVTLEEQDGNTTVKYVQLPSNLGITPGVAATIAQRRDLVLYKTNMAAARKLLVENPKYFNELIGFTSPQGFKPINEVLTCKTAQAPVPEDTIAALPDGNYRFWSGKGSTKLTDNELLKQGGMLFLFTKQGDQIHGAFAPVDNFGTCVQGKVSGNTVTGIAIPAEPSTNPASRANKAFDPVGFLMLGSYKKVGDRNLYEGSVLNLTNFTRINLGPRRPPKPCL
jgi:hypothetical protein